MSYSATSPISKGRLLPGLASRLPTGQKSLLGAAVAVLAAVIFLTWMLAAGPWPGSDDTSTTSESGRFGGKTVGAPAMVPAPAGASGFFGEDSGAFAALDARTGEPLWHFQANQDWKASPMTYMVGGRQYVAIASGMGFWAFALPE